jgi:hypothetical protein
MARQSGNIRYTGSFKSIRNYKNRKDPTIYAGEKGGANGDQIKNNPAFARTRENMSEFKGCGEIVKSIRLGLQHLIPEHTDKSFTGRLVALVKMINLRDVEGIRGKRMVCFSLNKSILKTLTLHENRKIDHQLKRSITRSHPEMRTEATITLNGFNPEPQLIPSTAKYFRVHNHLSVISDFEYSEELLKYNPLSKNDSLSAYAYSDYIPVNTPLTGSVRVAFPEGTILTETDTVLQCVGIEFYTKLGTGEYLPFKAGSVIVYDVF